MGSLGKSYPDAPFLPTHAHTRGWGAQSCLMDTFMLLLGSQGLPPKWATKVSYHREAHLPNTGKTSPGHPAVNTLSSNKGAFMYLSGDIGLYPVLTRRREQNSKRSWTSPNSGFSEGSGP